ncbi:hypothetical protein [Georgenia sp. SUBG003]|uniref:hypothetical protein n=1 Tax=Georgenia sp. SUBG003 TaxID=1497974 RepID=UPI003AB3D6AD
MRQRRPAVVLEVDGGDELVGGAAQLSGHRPPVGVGGLDVGTDPGRVRGTPRLKGGGGVTEPNQEPVQERGGSCDAVQREDLDVPGAQRCILELAQPVLEEAHHAGEGDLGALDRRQDEIGVLLRVRPVPGAVLGDVQPAAGGVVQGDDNVGGEVVPTLAHRLVESDQDRPLAALNLHAQVAELFLELASHGVRGALLQRERTAVARPVLAVGIRDDDAEIDVDQGGEGVAVRDAAVDVGACMVATRGELFAQRDGDGGASSLCLGDLLGVDLNALERVREEVLERRVRVGGCCAHESVSVRGRPAGARTDVAGATPSTIAPPTDIPGLPTPHGRWARQAEPPRPSRLRNRHRRHGPGL